MILPELNDVRVDLALRIFADAKELTGSEVAEGMRDALNATDADQVIAVEADNFPESERLFANNSPEACAQPLTREQVIANAVAQIRALTGDDLGTQANLLVQMAHGLDLVSVVFTQNDCDEDVELDAIGLDLRDALIARGNAYIGECSALRS